MRLIAVLFACSLAFLTVCAAQPLLDEDDLAFTQYRHEDLRRRLPALDAAAQNYFIGMIASREGHPEESIRALGLALPALRKTHPFRATQALRVLGDDHVKLFQYREAAEINQDLLANFSAQMAPAELLGLEEEAALTRSLADAPAQTITEGPVDIPLSRNPVGSLMATLSAKGVEMPWLLDTGANQSIVTDSFARRLGLARLPGESHIQDALSGAQIPVQAAILPELRIGRAVVRNVVVLVVEDSRLDIPYDTDGHRYQLNAILGYPVFAALKRVTFRREGRLLAGPSAESAASGAPILMNMMSPVVECGVGGQLLPFSLDTGASVTELFPTYYKRFEGELANWRSTEAASAGAGGIDKRRVYVQSALTLEIGEHHVTLRNVTIDTVAKAPSKETLFGNLGQDAIGAFDSFTLDFAAMRFSLGKPMPSAR